MTSSTTLSAASGCCSRYISSSASAAACPMTWLSMRQELGHGNAADLLPALLAEGRRQQAPQDLRLLAEDEALRRRSRPSRDCGCATLRRGWHFRRGWRSARRFGTTGAVGAGAAKRGRRTAGGRRRQGRGCGRRCDWGPRGQEEPAGCGWSPRRTRRGLQRLRREVAELAAQCEAHRSPIDGAAALRRAIGAAVRTIWANVGSEASLVALFPIWLSADPKLNASAALIESRTFSRASPISGITRVRVFLAQRRPKNIRKLFGSGPQPRRPRRARRRPRDDRHCRTGLSRCCLLDRTLARHRHRDVTRKSPGPIYVPGGNGSADISFRRRSEGLMSSSSRRCTRVGPRIVRAGRWPRS